MYNSARLSNDRDRADLAFTTSIAFSVSSIHFHAAASNNPGCISFEVKNNTRNTQNPTVQPFILVNGLTIPHAFRSKIALLLRLSNSKVRLHSDNRAASFVDILSSKGEGRYSYLLSATLQKKVSFSGQQHISTAILNFIWSAHFRSALRIARTQLSTARENIAETFAVASTGLEEKEEFICQANKRYNYNKNRNTLTGCQGRYEPIDAGHLWQLYTNL